MQFFLIACKMWCMKVKERSDNNCLDSQKLSCSHDKICTWLIKWISPCVPFSFDSNIDEFWAFKRVWMFNQSLEAKKLENFGGHYPDSPILFNQLRWTLLVHLEKLLLKARSFSSHKNGLQILASKRNTHTTNPRQQMLCMIYVIWTGSLWSSSVTQASNSTRQELLVSLLLCVCSRHFQYFYLLFGNHQL